MPEIAQFRLPNGLRVLALEDARLPRVAMRLAFDTGRVHNPDENLSLVPLCVEILKEGTREMDSAEIAQKLDQWAIDYDCDVYPEHSLLSMAVLREHLRKALELLSEMVLRPSFPEVELERLKIRWRSHLVAERSVPSFLAEERVLQGLFRRHPYSKLNPSLEQLHATGRPDLQEIHAGHMLPSRAILLLAGDLTTKEALSMAGEHFGDWPAGSPREVEILPPTIGNGECRVQLVDRPHSAQARLSMAIPTFARGHADTRRFLVANQILGGGSSARLFLNLREEKGYTYGIYSQVRLFQKAGLEVIAADIGSSFISDSVREIRGELSRLGDLPPSEEELRMAKAELIGDFLFQLETPVSTGMLELTRLLFDLPENHFRDFVPQTLAVSAEDVREAAGRYLEPQGFLITIVGDGNEVGNAAREFGEVDSYDLQGRRVDLKDESRSD